VAKSGLRDSLQTLNINNCGLNTGEVQAMLAKHGLTGVRVVREGNEPLVS